MEFYLGIACGLVLATIVVSTLAYFRRVIEHKIQIIEKQIDVLGPRPKGFIIEAMEDAIQAREEIIQKNKEAGRDTLLSELE